MPKQPIFNRNRLRGRIAEYGESYRSLSDKTGIKVGALSKKVNHQSEFKASEMLKICEILDIPLDEIPVFFATESIGLGNDS